MDRGTAETAGWLSAEEYDFIYSRVPRICVDLVIKNKAGGILYSLREIEPYKDLWHLPGGKINFRESIEHAIQRIANSELGTGVTVRAMLGYMEFLEERQNSQSRHSISIAFAAELKDDNIKGSFQGNNLKFFAEIPEQMHPVHGQFLKQYA